MRTSEGGRSGPGRHDLATRVGLVVAVLTGLAGLTGCGGASAAGADGGASASPSPVSAADQDCRDSWAGLLTVAQERSRIGANLRRAFDERWNAVEAGIDYYVQVADPSACGDLLATRRTKVERLGDVVAKALPYDAGQRRATAFALRKVYATMPKGAEEPKPVTQAYTLLAKQTPKAAADLAPAYDELARANPSDAKAVARAVDDVKLLADTSDAYNACSAALGTVQTWHDGLVKKPKQK